MRTFILCVLVLGVNVMLGTATDAIAQDQNESTISGELQQWHKVTLTIDGPETSEDAESNPFMDYRMQVKFHHAATGLSYNVPGYFAADGNAANTSATAGNKWRAHLSPDHQGEWSYSVSFRRGDGVAIADDETAGKPVSGVDGLTGSFEITKSDKTGRDFRSKGRLSYVGTHHLQFAGTKEFFLKAGADAPENFLAYRDFDGDFKTDGHKDGLVKDWAPHVQDWRSGDPTWQDGKGKGIIGAVNYLASQGLNSFSFLTLNIEGDDQNVFPYTSYDERARIDCSRMDQWETVFAHGTKRGMYLHFKTLEAENVNLLDDGHMGPQRKLYYRELIARFAHHLALNWNLGEEVGLGHKVSTEKKVAWGDYFHKHDPYQHHIVIHNGNDHFDMLGTASALTGFSLQTNRADFSNVHGATLKYIRRSVEAGKPWVVACDEPGDAQHSLIPDSENPDHDNARQNALWGNLMAGGAGVEWYFGYSHAHNDLSCQDYRVRQNMWEQSKTAMKFFADHGIPFWEMTNSNGLLNHKDSLCLSKAGDLYLVYSKTAHPTKLDLSEARGVFEVLWFDPRDGGELQFGSTQALNAGGKVMIGEPPSDPDKDWLAVIRKGDPSKDYPPGVNSGPDLSIMLRKAKESVTVKLNGRVSDDRTPGTELKSNWTKVSGPGIVEFLDATSAQTEVTLPGVGQYVLKLTTSDGNQASQTTVKVTVSPYQFIVSRTFSATEDAYLEGESVLRNGHLKVEGNRRMAIIKFDVRGLPPKILDAQLRLTVEGDAGVGTLRTFAGSHSDWAAKTMKRATAPTPGKEIASLAVRPHIGDVVSIPVRQMLDGDGFYTVILKLDKGGDDIWFGSTAGDNGPDLFITFEGQE